MSATHSQQLAVMTPEQIREYVGFAVREELGAMVRQMMRPTDVLVPKEAAEYIKQSEGTLRQWRSQGRGPAYLKDRIGVRYLKKDLDAWLLANRTLTSETPDAPHV